MEALRAQLRHHALGAWRHRWIAVAVAWFVCLAGWAWVGSMPDSYEADARLYIDTDAVLAPLLKGTALDNGLNNQIEVLQRTLLRRPTLEKLIAETGLGPTVHGPGDTERLVATLGTAIRIAPQAKNLFTISYRNTSPQLAHDVVSAIVNGFVESETGKTRNDMATAREALAQQIAAAEARLREADSKRAEFRARHADLLPADVGGLSRLDAARAAVRALEGQLADATARRDRLAQQLAVTPATMVADADPGAAAAPGSVAPGPGGGELAAAEQRLRELLLVDTEQHPDVVRQRRLIEKLRAAGGSGAAPATTGRPARSRSQPNPAYDQLKAQKLQADADLDALRRQVADATRERDRLEEIARGDPGVQAQLGELDRDDDVARKAYDALVAERESLRLSAVAASEADKARLRVVDAPEVPRLPAEPKRVLLLSGVLLAGLGGGLAAAVLRGQLDRAFYSVRDLRDLGLPIAGGISLLAGMARGRLRRAPAAAALALSLLLLCGVYGGLLYRVIKAMPT